PAAQNPRCGPGAASSPRNTPPTGAMITLMSWKTIHAPVRRKGGRRTEAREVQGRGGGEERPCGGESSGWLIGGVEIQVRMRERVGRGERGDRDGPDEAAFAIL